MIFGVSERDAQISCKRRSTGAREDFGTKGLEIRLENSITKKYLKRPQDLHHCEELVETIRMDTLFVSFWSFGGKVIEKIRLNGSADVMMTSTPPHRMTQQAEQPTRRREQPTRPKGQPMNGLGVNTTLGTHGRILLTSSYK